MLQGVNSIQLIESLLSGDRGANTFHLQFLKTQTTFIVNFFSYFDMLLEKHGLTLL